MNRDRCREIFAASVSRPETAVLIDAPEEGDCPACSAARSQHQSQRTRNFETLCHWLDLPRLGLVDVRKLQLCRHPRLPAPVDGLLLDGVESIRQFVSLQTELEALWRVPVLGYLQIPASLRATVEKWNCETPPSVEVLSELVQHLTPHWDENQLGELLQRPALPWQFNVASKVPAFGPQVRIAIAQDEAFGLCFPEVLDALERAGATLCDFSPLRSDRLPENCDLVYFGCGHPERFAHQLAGNHCMIQSVRSFAATGGRIYAEASGSAYLCRQLILPGGSAVTMTGLLPANARYSNEAAAPQQAEVSFGLGCWLADRHAQVRGYRDLHWQLEPCGAMLTYAGDPAQRCDILGRGNVICSRILLNIAANPQLLERFVRPAAMADTALRASW
jgi:cobyrinic acid a,c-diamide synthase